MRPDERSDLLGRLLVFAIFAAATVTAIAVLAVRVKRVQVDDAADYGSEMTRQSFRRVQTAGLRGRILARGGEVLADNRQTYAIALLPEAFRPRKGAPAAAQIEAAVGRLAALVGRSPDTTTNAVERHLRFSRIRPCPVWSDVNDAEIARFAERAGEHPGFIVIGGRVRRYPQGKLAAHLLGYVGNIERMIDSGDTRMNAIERESKGRSGIEYQYDEFLRGMAGEERVFVDARGYATARETLIEPCAGPDLKLTIDLELQRAAESVIADCCGAFVAIDPRDGSVRALASAPGFDPNRFVPSVPRALYDSLRDDPARPLLDRATNGQFAPGSIFKPVTAIAGLGMGISPDDEFECTGVYRLGTMRIRCARTWGHGGENMVHALRDSCNPYFCHLGVQAGTNAILRTAAAFGLGARTGLDFPTDAAGVLPDAAWKERNFGDRWRPGDVAQMAMGQGMLLVTPLQMARMAAAIGTGQLVVPRLNAGLPAKSEPLEIDREALATVREGMRQVVEDPVGTGRRGGLGVDARVIGKTGTAQVGRGETLRKNTWFMAYAEPTATSRRQEPIAVALIVERGESGGGTAAPRVGDILRIFYNRTSPEGA